jgi:hypothetical protein
VQQGSGGTDTPYHDKARPSQGFGRLNQLTVSIEEDFMDDGCGTRLWQGLIERPLVLSLDSLKVLEDKTVVRSGTYIFCYT